MNMSRRCIVVLSSDFYHPPSLSPPLCSSAEARPSSSSSSSSQSLPAPSCQSSSRSCRDASQNWAPLELQHALDLMRNHRDQIIPLTHRDFSLKRFDQSDSTVKMIRYVLNNLSCLRWNHTHGMMDDETSKRLQLRLPPIRHRPNEYMSWHPHWFSKTLSYSNSKSERSVSETSDPPSASLSACSEHAERLQFPSILCGPDSLQSTRTALLSSADSFTVSQPAASTPSCILKMPEQDSEIANTSSSMMLISSLSSSPPLSITSLSSQECSSAEASPSSTLSTSLGRDVPQSSTDVCTNQTYNTNSSAVFSTFNFKKLLRRSPAGHTGEQYLIDNEYQPHGFITTHNERNALNVNY